MKYITITKLASLIERSRLNIPQPGDVTESKVTGVLELVFGIFATISILIISIGALKMILSKGNPQEVAKARDTIIYASVGLVISLSAFMIVRFVLGSVK